MGGLKRELPVTYWTFLIGALAIAGVPLSGFFSKDEILFRTFASGHTLLWVVGLLTSLLTAIPSACSGLVLRLSRGVGPPRTWPALSTWHRAPSTQHPAPSTQGSISMTRPPQWPLR